MREGTVVIRDSTNFTAVGFDTIETNESVRERRRNVIVKLILISEQCSTNVFIYNSNLTNKLLVMNTRLTYHVSDII